MDAHIDTVKIYRCGDLVVSDSPRYFPGSITGVGYHFFSRDLKGEGDNSQRNEKPHGKEMFAELYIDNGIQSGFSSLGPAQSPSTTLNPYSWQIFLVTALFWKRAFISIL